MIKKRVQKIEVPKKNCGTIQKKILLCLLTGIAIGLSRSPKQQFKIARGLPKELNAMGKSVPRAIRSLYNTKLLKTKVHKDGSHTLILSESGRRKALTYHAETMKFSRFKKWDKKWRFVMYDIPEHSREARVSLRKLLLNAGMYELQQSVFVYPYDCKEEVTFLVELHNVRRYVRYVVADEIDNELHLRKTFRLR